MYENHHGFNRGEKFTHHKKKRNKTHGALSR